MTQVRPLHWAARFALSLWPVRPGPDQRRWAQGWLSEAEQTLFARMSGPDQRHAVAVARFVERRLGELAPDVPPEHHRDVMAAALLHDVGKTAAGLGIYGRVVATLCGVVARDMAEAWQATSGFTRKVGLHLRYGELGAEQLTVAQSAPWVVAWAAQHHLSEDEWTIPLEVGRLLVAADR